MFIIIPIAHPNIENIGYTSTIPDIIATNLSNL